MTPPPALPLPGQPPRPDTSQPHINTLPSTELQPHEVGYISRRPANMAVERAEALRHTPESCEAEHCSCHLPAHWQPPNLQITAREAMVLTWHLFTSEDEELSFEEIGQRLGVGPTRVQAIYRRAVAKMRAHALVYYPPRPGTPDYEKRTAEVEKYKSQHPEYGQNRALLDVMDQVLPDHSQDINPFTQHPEG